ncbi:MAG: NUDIX domain-containing protein, partial [Nitrososphaera sp.]|nr:NUDIX domain-containing protein [Nitrososphaera sp.]
MSSRVHKYMHLQEQEFLEVVAKAPLVSIDLVITDRAGRILMGRRVNEPAKGKWFVPGGRIYKHESLDDAFKRVCVTEIGQSFSRSDARFIGVFTHQYDTNFASTPGVTTHYVVLAYELRPTQDVQPRTAEQHSEFRWFGPTDRDGDIHQYSMEYFHHPSRIDETQYGVLNARRDSFNNLLWQTPALSLTAQAFLFTIILSTDSAPTDRMVASLLAFITAVVSV